MHNYTYLRVCGEDFSTMDYLLADRDFEIDFEGTLTVYERARGVRPRKVSVTYQVGAWIRIEPR